MAAEEEHEPRKHSEESVKLFVGQIPKHMNEAELLEMFEQFAIVDQVNVIKDKSTRVSRGCCFVICPSREEADKAVNACHNKKTLNGASSPLQVKYADGELERLEHKLFVGMLPRIIEEAEVSELFSRYGNIRDLQILKGPQETSKGCAFLKYETKEQALQAIEALNGKHKMEGASVPLVVKWADTEKERHARRAQKAAQSQTSLNLPNIEPSLFGALPMSNYIPPYNQYGYQTPGGYGLMPYRPPHGFHNMIRPLNERNPLRGVGPRNYPISPGGYVPLPGAQAQYPRNRPMSGNQIEGPPGANLFIYHIPQDFGDEELIKTFEPFGRVLSAKVFIDKATGISKCFGFVSYDSSVAAQTAINMMNGYQLGGKKLKVQLKRDNSQSNLF